MFFEFQVKQNEYVLHLHIKWEHEHVEQWQGTSWRSLCITIWDFYIIVYSIVYMIYLIGLLSIS